LLSAIQGTLESAATPKELFLLPQVFLMVVLIALSLQKSFSDMEQTKPQNKSVKEEIHKVGLVIHQISLTTQNSVSCL